MPTKAPSKPPPDKTAERFTFTLSCSTGAVIAIAVTIAAVFLIANGFDPVAFLEAFAKIRR
ncbi:hypothetical protein AB0K48_00675 [Nonomuraea sp. NPDC055795]